METHPTHPTRHTSTRRAIDRTTCPRWTAGDRGPRHHGTESAFRLGCRCDDARRESRLINKRRRVGTHQPRTVDAVGTRRRLRALACMGWRCDDVAAMLGVQSSQLVQLRSERKATVHVSTRDAVAALYRRLSARPGPSPRAARRARVRGWASPLEWHDIDDPNETVMHSVRDSQFLDLPVALNDEVPDSADTMALASVTAGGSWSVLRPVDQEAVVIALRATLTAAEIAVHARATEGEINTILDRLRRRDRKARARQNGALVPTGSATETRTEPAA